MPGLHIEGQELLEGDGVEVANWPGFVMEPETAVARPWPSCSALGYRIILIRMFVYGSSMASMLLALT